MARITLKNRKYGTKNGGGFFNYFRRKKTAPNTTAKKLIGYPPRYGFAKEKEQYELLKNSEAPTSLEPFSVNIQNERREFFPEYESYRDASQRMFSFIYQKYKRLPYNPEKITLTPAEMSELKKAFLLEMKKIGSLKAGLNSDKIKYILREMFGLKTQNEIKKFEKEYTAVESSIPQVGPSTGLLPLRPFTFISRLIPAILKSERELQYTRNQEMYLCPQIDYAKNSYKTLNSNDCIYIVRSIPHLFKGILALESSIVNVLYLVLNPIYFPVGGERIKGEIYNTNIDSKANEPVSIKMKAIDKVSFVQDAFKYGGVELVHPRLGLLLQEQLPRLWNQSCFNTKNGKTVSGRTYDLVDRIVILTLQKYAAIKRYMWSKNPSITSEIYKVNPKTIADELRDIYKVLPSSVITNANRTSDYFDIIRKIPSFETFDEKAFQKEFIENQQWASNSKKIRYTSVKDPALNDLLPCSYWELPPGPVDIEQTKIPPLRELNEIKNYKLTLNNIYLSPSAENKEKLNKFLKETNNTK